MTREIIDTPDAPGAAAYGSFPYSQAVKAAGLVFVSGQGPFDPGTGAVVGSTIEEQTRQVCENIGRALRSVGGDYSDVVKTTTFTTDVDEYHRVNDERRKYFKTDLPTSALIGVKRLADPALMVEIECMAVIPTERFKPTS